MSDDELNATRWSSFQSRRKDDGSETQSPQLAGLIKKAKALKLGDDRGVIALLAEAAALKPGLDDLQADAADQDHPQGDQARPHDAARRPGRSWSSGRRRKLGRPARPSASGRKPSRRRAGSMSGRWSASNYGPRARASPRTRSCSIKMEKAAHELGVVNEGAGVRATYLTCTSRLLADEAGRLLRTGAPASGKNLVVEMVLAFIPADAIVQVSGSSPKSLAYYGGEDPDALKHKIVYVPKRRSSRRSAAKRTTSPSCCAR